VLGELLVGYRNFSTCLKMKIPTMVKDATKVNILPNDRDTVCSILSQNFQKACRKRTIKLLFDRSAAMSSGRQDDLGLSFLEIGSHSMPFAQIQKESCGGGSPTRKGRGTLCTNADAQIIAPAGPNKTKET
jgi:hypothetical protein